MLKPNCCTMPTVSRSAVLTVRRLRVTEHNILVVCKYYSRIRLARLAQLLDLPVAEAERHLSNMVVGGALSAKIDRPAGAS